MINQHVVSGVTVKWDSAKHPKVNVKEGNFDKTKIPTGVQDEFTPARIVVDLKLDLGDPTAQSVTLDDVHVQIPYSPSVVPGTPTVGWWNGKKWVTFKHVTFANNVADVTLPSPWPTDPAIGTYP